MAPSDLAPFLLTLDSARQVVSDIPTGKPLEQRNLAALIVAARAIRRSTVERDPVAFDPEIHEGRGRPPQDPTDYENNTMRWFRRATPDSKQVTPIDVTDKPVFLRELYVPSLPVRMSYESFVERVSAYHQPIPDVLRVEDLQAKALHDNAYRGGPSKIVGPRFHGYEFRDAVDKAKDGLFRWKLSGEMKAYQVVAWAWPLLWVKFANPNNPAATVDIIITPDQQGQLQSIMSVSSS